MSPELFIAVLKLVEMVGVNKLKISKSNVNKAMQLQDAIDKNVLKFLNGEELNLSTISRDEAKEVKNALLELNPEALLTNLIPILSKENIGVEVGVKIMEMAKQLASLAPETDGVSQNTKFLWRARIAENPLWSIQLMSDQMLSKIDVDTLRNMYPDIYEMIVNSLIENIIEKFTVEKQVPRRIKLMMSVLLQTPVLDLKTITAFDKDQEGNKSVDLRIPKEV